MIKNGIYNFIGGAIRLGLGIITVPFLIQILGLKQYGLYAIINAILLFAMLSEWSIATSMTVFLSPAIESDQKGAPLKTGQIIKAASIVVITLSSVTATLLLLVISLFPVFLVGLPKSEVIIISQCCQLGIFLVWIRLIQQLFVGVEQAYQQYGPSNIINTVFGILISLGTLLTAYLSHNLVSIFYFQSIMTLLSMGVHGWFCLQKRLILINFWQTNLVKGQVKEIMQYSIKAWTGSLGAILFTQGDRILVGNLLGSEVVGIYAALTNITSQINNLSAMPLQTIIPELSQANEQINSSVEQYTDWSFNPQKIISAYSINLFLALLLGAGIIGFAPEALVLLSLVNIPNYNVAFLTQCFIFLGVIYSVYSVNALGFYVLLALRETSAFLGIQLISGSIALITVGGLSYFYGLSGAIVGNTLYLLVFCFTLFAAKKLLIPISKFIRVTILPFCLFTVFVSVCSINDSSLVLRLVCVTTFSLYAIWRLLNAIQVYKLTKFVYQPTQV